MKTFFLAAKLTIFFVILSKTHPLTARSTFNPEDPQQLQDAILYQDSLFWTSYNTCDLDKLQTFFTEDLEFYHDKGGLTTTLTIFMESMKKGMCSDENWRLRREVVGGSLAVHPIPGYGALLTGEHVFYVKEKDKKERLDGRATFLHVWEFKDDKWKMSRVFSYAHTPVKYESQKMEVSLPAEMLGQFVGSYESSQMGTVTITKKEGVLSLQSGGFEATLYPENENTFFIKERDIQFRFIKDGNNMVSKMEVIENGDIVDTARKAK